jgi:hypothetical protein
MSVEGSADLNSAAAGASVPVSVEGASVASVVVSPVDGAAVGAVPPQAERAMLAITSRLNKANILRILFSSRDYDVQTYTN